MRIHEKGQLINGIRNREIVNNFGQNSIIEPINSNSNIIRSNQINMNSTNQIKIIPKKVENNSIQNLMIGKNMGILSEDITMNDSTKTEKNKK